MDKLLIALICLERALSTPEAPPPVATINFGEALTQKAREVRAELHQKMLDEAEASAAKELAEAADEIQGIFADRMDNLRNQVNECRRRERALTKEMDSLDALAGAGPKAVPLLIATLSGFHADPKAVTQFMNRLLTRYGKPILTDDEAKIFLDVMQGK